MKVEDIINKEIVKIIKQQINDYMPIINAREMNFMLKKLCLRSSLNNYKRVRGYALGHKVLKQIPDLQFYIECIFGIFHPSQSTNSAKIIRQRLDRNPDNLALAFFWVNRNINEMSDEFAEIEIPFFLNDVIKEFPNLFLLEDFLENSFAIQLEEEKIINSPRLYIPVFSKAIERFPEKLSFLYGISIAYYYNNQIDESIAYYDLLVNWMGKKVKNYQDENIDDNLDFYKFTFLAEELLHYHEVMKNYTDTLNICTKIQQLYFNYFIKADPDLNTYKEFFIELSFRKMDIFLSRNEFEAINNEYNMIQAYIENNTYFKTRYTNIYEMVKEKSQANTY